MFFPVIVNTYAGAANIETHLLGRGTQLRRQPLCDVYARGIFRRAADDLRRPAIALGVSFIVLVAAEFVATKTGIGYLIWNSWELLQVDYMFVGIVVIGILGLVTTVLFREIERKLIPWKE